MPEHLTIPVAGFPNPDQLHQDGYALLRGAIPLQWRNELRLAFDDGVIPNDQWPVPRGRDWRHSSLDLLPLVQSVCCLPDVLAAVATLINERFFLSQVEGREPLAGGGYQGLHRDFTGQRHGDSVFALAYLDDYGPDNGATRIVPCSHRTTERTPVEYDDASESVQLSGCAGDILVCDSSLVHAASLNPSGARRRSLLIGYFAEPLYASHLKTAQLRNIRMQTLWFDPLLIEK